MTYRFAWTAVFFLLALFTTGSVKAEDVGSDPLPNIVVILTDDQGYADVSFNPLHPSEVATPSIDRLAAEGVFCSQGYTTGHVCSPTRAGLMTGRYQQRMGIYTAGEGGSGVPLDERFLPQYLAEAGYVSGAYGKWHLGLTLEYNAVNRGFDEFYGFMGRGAHDYFDLKILDHPIYRGVTPIEDEGYLTTRITEEAVSFIERRAPEEGPFFLYVAYNAVHAPPQAPEEDIARFDTGDPTRDQLAAMLLHLDLGIGQITTALEATGEYDDTLLIFLTDNGGSGLMHANNAPLRGFKQEDYEGGVRVPFIVRWPSRLEAGTTCDVPVMSIDILPTALAAAGIEPTDEFPLLDGRDILPALEGDVDSLHETLYWSSAGGSTGKWAIRQGRWKLVGVQDRIELFDMENDVSETTDLAAAHPEIVETLHAAYDAWLDEMAPPMNGAPKHWSPAGESNNAPSGRRTQEREAS